MSFPSRCFTLPRPLGWLAGWLVDGERTLQRNQAAVKVLVGRCGPFDMEMPSEQDEAVRR